MRISTLKNKAIVSPFLQRLSILKKSRGQGHHFSAFHTNRVKFDEILEERPLLPRSSAQVDLNDARMNSARSLTCLSLRVKRALTKHFATRGIPVCLDYEDWEFAREVEGILNVSKDLVTLSQNE